MIHEENIFSMLCRCIIAFRHTHLKNHVKKTKMDDLKNVAGTPPGSLISLLIPPRAKLRHTIRMLNDERILTLGIVSETHRNHMVDIIERTIRIIHGMINPMKLSKTDSLSLPERISMEMSSKSGSSLEFPSIPRCIYATLNSMVWIITNGKT